MKSVKKVTLTKMQKERKGHGKAQTGIIQETRRDIKILKNYFKKLIKYYSKTARDATVAKL